MDRKVTYAPLTVCKCLAKDELSHILAARKKKTEKVQRNVPTVAAASLGLLREKESERERHQLTKRETPQNHRNIQYIYTVYVCIEYSKGRLRRPLSPHLSGGFLPVEAAEVGRLGVLQGLSFTLPAGLLTLLGGKQNEHREASDPFLIKNKRCYLLPFSSLVCCTQR